MRAIIIWSDQETYLLFNFAFKKAGYDITVVWIDDLETGFKTCLEYPPDLLIVERSVQDEDDGFNLCQRLRRVENLPYFPIVVGSVDVWMKSEEAFQQAAQAGADLSFGRVFSVGQVVKEISKLLDKSS